MNQISGVLSIDKPKSLTSHDVVGRIRKLTGQRKAGHTGTLDPMATGVLVVCVGQATRLIEYMVSDPKQYRATIRFGITTNTYDADGDVVNRHDVSTLVPEKMRAALPKFLGEIQQYPPIFSAIKRDGQPLYKAARKGIAVSVDPRPVTIYDLQWIAWQPPDLILEVSCSPGTYIRSLAHDLGQVVGTGAHLATLVRTANGPWQLDQAVALADLTEANWRLYLQALDRAVAHLPAVTLDTIDADHVRHGRQIELIDESLVSHTFLRAYDAADQLLAILKLANPETNLWRPKKVLRT
jgi:tRNA pseudouridine55 synthase